VRMMYGPTMIVVLPFILLMLYSQYKVKSTFNEYLSVPAEISKTGAQVAREILDREGLGQIDVASTEGELSDHYDPREKTVKLSSDVYQGSSLAAISVAAHETGHALQHAGEYAPLKVRHSLFPAANFGSQAGPFLALFGFLFRAEFLILLGIIFFAGAVLFQVATLPVEFNASSRALSLLKKQNYLSSKEMKGAKKVLRAAALTYVASTLVALGHLLRLILMYVIANDR